MAQGWQRQRHSEEAHFSSFLSLKYSSFLSFALKRTTNEYKLDDAHSSGGVEVLHPRRHEADATTSIDRSTCAISFHVKRDYTIVFLKVRPPLPRHNKPEPGRQA